MKLNLAAGAHPLEGFVNLDKQDGWNFEDGLPYEDESVEAITESHGLMYVTLNLWPFVFLEIARVLEPGGVVRITEDATDDPKSDRFGGFYDAVTLTTLKRVSKYLNAAGLRAVPMTSASSLFHDSSLKQSWHGTHPKVFFVEGVKE